jgi:chromosome segregation ATPase
MLRKADLQRALVEVLDEWDPENEVRYRADSYGDKVRDIARRAREVLRGAEANGRAVAHEMAADERWKRVAVAWRAWAHKLIGGWSVDEESMNVIGARLETYQQARGGAEAAYTEACALLDAKRAEVRMLDEKVNAMTEELRAALVRAGDAEAALEQERAQRLVNLAAAKHLTEEVGRLGHELGLARDAYGRVLRDRSEARHRLKVVATLLGAREDQAVNAAKEVRAECAKLRDQLGVVAGLLDVRDLRAPPVPGDADVGGAHVAGICFRMREAEGELRRLANWFWGYQ